MTDQDIRTTDGILTLAESARYLRVPQQTFHRWAKGYERGGALLHVLDAPPRHPSVTFMALTEGYVLEALRSAGVRPHRIRPALVELQRQFGREYVLSAPELATDGIDVLWDFSQSKAGSGLIEAGTGQHIIREIVTDFLSYITRGDEGLPTRLTLRACEPSTVFVDPWHAFGQPHFASGPRLVDVAAMLKAGEDVDVVAEEFGVTASDVRTAARVVLGHAA
jgi:uncharacterized protein (DUF433 family)